MGSSTQVLSDDLLHFGENRYNTFPSGLDKQFPVWIASNVLPKEVEALFEQPLMANVVEAAFDVAFEHPAWVFVAERSETLFNRVRTTSPLPEAVGILIRSGFRDRIERQQIQGLHG